MPRKSEDAKEAARVWNKTWRARLADLEGRSDGLNEAEQQELKLLDLRREIKRQRAKDRYNGLKREAEQPVVQHIELPPVGPLLDLQRKVLDDLRALEQQGVHRVG